jgi:hypothetical protein
MILYHCSVSLWNGVALVWCSMEWYNIWYDILWCVMIWYTMIPCGKNYSAMTLKFQHCYFRTDAFRIHVGEIGDIRSLRIRQDNSKVNPSWFLAAVSDSLILYVCLPFSIETYINKFLFP